MAEPRYVRAALMYLGVLNRCCRLVFVMEVNGNCRFCDSADFDMRMRATPLRFVSFRGPNCKGGLLVLC